MKCVNCGRPTDVRETRPYLPSKGSVLRRRRECSHCGHAFATYEIDAGLAKTIKRHLAPHIKAVAKRQALTQRNEQILTRLRAGDKHAAVALEFGLSDNMISTIARRAGVPAYARLKKLQ